MLVAVQRQHEIDQRALELCAGAHQHCKAGARNLGGPLEIDHAQLRTEVPVRFGLEVELTRLAPRAHHHVVGGALPHRHARVRQVGQCLQQDGALPLGALEFDFELLDLLPPHLARFEEVARVLPLSFGARHFVAGCVLLPLQSFDLRDQAAPVRLRSRQLL
jgi:hypothetical protein